MIKLHNGFAHSINSPDVAGLHQVTGLLDVQFVANDAGKTVLFRHKQKTPLKVTKTHELPDGRLGMTLMDCSPGMLSGDVYDIFIHVGRDCRVFANNQSFTRVHPAHPGQSSTLKQRIVLEQGANLEYAMEPTMLFRDAHFESSTEVELAAGSTFIFHDVLCPGRTSRGERFQYRRYSGRMSVQYGGELIYNNHICLEPSADVAATEEQDLVRQHKLPQTIGMWGDYTHLGNLLFFAERIDDHFVEQIRQEWADDAQLRHLRWGVSSTYKHGMAVIALADHAWQITKMFAYMSRFVTNQR